MQREIQLLCGVIFALSLAIAPQPLDLAERVSGPSQEQLLDAASDDRNWILQAHAYEGNRFLRNSSLTTHSVARLRRAWTYRIDDNTPIESSGLEWSGTIYVTSGHNNVYAVDALSGVERWRFTYHGSVFAFAVNRGLAIKDGVLFMGTTDGHVLALRATDAVRFAYLLLHKGRWGNRQLVPAEYVAMCGRPSPYNPHSPMSLMFETNAGGHVFGAPRDAFFKSGAGGHLARGVLVE